MVSLETGEPAGPGEVGEIQARSDSLMAGYLPAEATAEVFQAGWYRTGDVGWLDADGWLRITDRLKEMIKVRGFQVAPAEIETVLHGHPAVRIARSSASLTAPTVKPSSRPSPPPPHTPVDARQPNSPPGWMRNSLPTSV